MKSFFITYFSLVTMALIFISFSVLYHNKLHDNIYLKYLPDVQIYPQYCMERIQCTNKDEVIIWKDSDYVPWYGIALHEISFFTDFWVVLGYFLLVLLCPGIFFYNLVFNRKKATIIYCVVLTFELVLCFYLFGFLPID